MAIRIQVEDFDVGAELGRRRDLLDDPVHAVVAQALSAGVRRAAVELVRRRREVLPEGAAGERGHPLVEHVHARTAGP